MIYLKITSSENGFNEIMSRKTKTDSDLVTMLLTLHVHIFASNFDYLTELSVSFISLGDWTEISLGLVLPHPMVNNSMNQPEVETEKRVNQVTIPFIVFFNLVPDFLGQIECLLIG